MKPVAAETSSASSTNVRQPAFGVEPCWPARRTRSIGNISRLLAKMIGMTPAWLTLQRQVLPGAADRPAGRGRAWRSASGCAAGLGDERPRRRPRRRTGTTSTISVLDAVLAAPPSVSSASTLSPSSSISGAGHPGQDAGHDQQADAVADAVLVDLLAEPHQEHGAGGHRQRRAIEPVAEACRSRRWPGRAAVELGLHDVAGPRSTLWIKQMTTVA